MGGVTLTFFGFLVTPPPICFCKPHVFVAEFHELPACPESHTCRLILNAVISSGIGLDRDLALNHTDGDVLVRFSFLTYAREVSVAVPGLYRGHRVAVLRLRSRLLHGCEPLAVESADK